VTEFYAAIAGPRLERIVHWEDSAAARPDDARIGDRVTLLLQQEHEDPCEMSAGGTTASDLAVMFCPHQPAQVVRVLDDGLQVYVPEGARTGPVAIVRKDPDFTSTQRLLAQYSEAFPAEWSLSVFSCVRMDLWAFPDGFGPPTLEILDEPTQTQPPPSTTAPNVALTPALGTPPAGSAPSAAPMPGAS